MEAARSLYEQGFEIKALQLTEECNESHLQGERMTNLQGEIFLKLGIISRNSDLKVTYFLGAIECFSRISLFPVYMAKAKVLLNLTDQCGSEIYFKKAAKTADKAFAFLSRHDLAENQEMGNIIKISKSNIKYGKIISKNRIVSPIETCQMKSLESEEGAYWEGMQTNWKGLKVYLKRRFMKVSISELKLFMEAKNGDRGLLALEHVLDYAKKQRKWLAYICRSCSNRFSTAIKLTDHLEHEHAPNLHRRLFILLV